MKYFANFDKISYDILGDGSTREITNIFRKFRVNPLFLDNITFYRYYTIRNGERPDTLSFKLYGKTDFYWTFSVLNPWLIDMKKDWPMDSTELEHYIEDKYKNKSLIINDLTLASKYQIGETVQGLVSNASGVVVNKNVNLKQITLSDVTGSFQNGELIFGQTSQDYLNVDFYVDEANAIHHYELSDGTIVDRFTVGAQGITNSEYEIAVNENHSIIKVIRPELITEVSKRFMDIIKS